MSEVEDVLDRSERMLKAAYLGYNQYIEAEGEEKIIRLYNVVNFGRSVTFTLQNLRGKADGFDSWYDEKQQVLKEDDVCSYMVELRNDIVKEGDPKVACHTHGDGFNSDRVKEDIPPWADGAFIGDQIGGSGFFIKHPDGSEEKYYTDLDYDGLEVDLVYEGTLEYEGSFPEDISHLDEDLRYYIRILGELVSDAQDNFG